MPGLPQLVGEQRTPGIQRQAGALVEGDVDIGAAVAAAGPWINRRLHSLTALNIVWLG
ncbi:hypothetical protein [Streptomyces sp. NPDC055992]|uniref:hypothetical protein n=1 Tax=Streptomyces sp. NPDC055992 TaxID=3345673 RepID=UPI0035E29066